MLERAILFNLETKFQDRLRYFMAAFAVIHLLALLIPGQTTSFVFTTLAVVINLFILYFSFSIPRAPNFYFKLITWFFWLSIIFDGLELYSVLSGQEAFSLKHIPSILTFVLSLAIATTLSKYRASINNLKKAEITS